MKLQIIDEEIIKSEIEVSVEFLRLIKDFKYYLKKYGDRHIMFQELNDANLKMLEDNAIGINPDQFYDNEMLMKLLNMGVG
jgi:hypothetical protein